MGSPSLLVVFHICAGILGLMSGAVAAFLRKGSSRHSVAGRIFAVSMLSMSGSGAYIAFGKSQTVNFLMGLLTFYLVATAWATARRKAGETGIFDWIALLFGLAVGSTMVTYGLQAANSQTRLMNGYPAGFYFFFGSIALLSVVGDVRMLRNSGVFGTHRIARHLWRMCFALFIAAASFFLGQQKVFPASWRGSSIWFVPPALALLLLIFWLVRVSITKAWKERAASLGLALSARNTGRRPKVLRSE